MRRSITRFYENSFFQPHFFQNGARGNQTYRYINDHLLEHIDGVDERIAFQPFDHTFELSIDDLETVV
ncbi:MAG: hypothetical protein F4X56_01060 [Gammaproteobacteria bacterium]|nr:hypothetical protein [Gammaproteobacteria bacterium]